MVWPSIPLDRRSAGCIIVRRTDYSVKYCTIYTAHHSVLWDVNVLPKADAAPDQYSEYLWLLMSSGGTWGRWAISYCILAQSAA